MPWLTTKTGIEGQRYERQQDRGAAEPDEDRRHKSSPRIASHAPLPAPPPLRQLRFGRVHAPNEQSRQRVDDQRDREQHETDLDERVEVELVAASVNSFASTAAIVYCGAKRESEPAVVANHHRHRHGLAQGPAEAEHDGADDPGARVEERRPIASNRVAPSAYAPSRCAIGTDLSTSRRPTS
jgi:hypothetical protein